LRQEIAQNINFDKGENMRLRIRLPIAIALILVAAASAFPREVKSDYDHHANFSQYKTYSWAKVETTSPLWNDRVKEAVDRELAAKGWTQVPSDGDVSIVAIGTTRDKPTLQTFYDGFDGWLWNGFGDATTYVEHYTEGTLVIDMFDTKSKKLVWRGSVSDMISDKPEKNIKELDTSVHKLFDRFPPRQA
jgi:acylphosphatase